MRCVAIFRQPDTAIEMFLTIRTRRRGDVARASLRHQSSAFARYTRSAPGRGQASRARRRRQHARALRLIHRLDVIRSRRRYDEHAHWAMRVGAHRKRGDRVNRALHRRPLGYRPGSDARRARRIRDRRQSILALEKMSAPPPVRQRTSACADATRMSETDRHPRWSSTGRSCRTPGRTVSQSTMER